MNKMKRLLSVLLTVSVLLICAGITVSADAYALTVASDVTSADAGNTVTITVKAPVGLKGVSFDLLFDQAAFTVSDASITKITSGYSEANIVGNKIRFAYANATPLGAEATVLTVAFKAKTLAEDANGSFTVENAKVVDATAETAATANSVSVAVKKSSGPLYTLGDVDDDGEITFVDALMILRHEAGLAELQGTALLAGDVDGDDEVGFVDALYVLRYEAGLIEEF